MAMGPPGAAIGDARSLDARPRAWGRSTLGVASVLAGLLLWEIAGALGWVNRIILSPPHAVALAGVELARSGELTRHLGISLRELGVGLVLAVSAGVPIGVLAGWSRRLSWILRPLIAVFYATPVIVFAPLIVAWLGIGFWDKVLLVFISGFLQIFIATSAGIRATERKWVRLARSFRASQRKVFWSIVLPSALPYILLGLRLAVGRCVVNVVVAEMLAAEAGVGYMIAYFGNTFRVAEVFVALVSVVVTGVILNQLLLMVEERVGRWRQIVR